MYKERKETTNVKVGEENIHYHINISKLSTVYVNMVTRPVYKKKKLKEAPTTTK